MGKKVAPPKEPLYVREWIEALEVDQSEVVSETGISQPYISNMSEGRKSNPSAAYLRRISRFLGISTDDLYTPPPPKPHIDAIKRLSAAAREALARPKRARAR